MKLKLLWVLMAPALAACSSMQRSRDAADLTGQFGNAPDAYIVAAIDNPRPASAGRAGSTPRGYDSAKNYGPSLWARQTMHAVAAQYGLREVASWPIDPLHMHCAVFEVPPDSDRNTILAALAHDRRVKLAQPLQTFTTRSEAYNDPYVGLQHGFQLMDIPDAHPLSRGEGVKIALIDTGADITHPDLRGRVIATRNFVDADDRQFRRDIHGTEVAGVIAAVANNHEGIVGVSPGARLMVFKACWQLSPGAAMAHCNSFTLAKALVAALDARAQIVNLSLAGPNDALLRALMQEGMRRGILFVGAAPTGVTAGNDSFMQQGGVITVATAEEPRSAGTAYIYAPGRDILTLEPDGHYGFASGSSLATAHITGTVALLLAKHPSLTSAAVYRLLNDATARMASGTEIIHSVDGCAALIALLGHGQCRRRVSQNDATKIGENRLVRHWSAAPK